MGKFKGIKPAAQPRTLRSIAESNKAEFPEAIVEELSMSYDVAEEARPETVAQSGAKAPPFAVKGGGR